MTGMCQDFRPQAGLLPLTIYLAAPRGFCAGVDRAIEIVERAIDRYGAPVYVRHEIVHNRFVVDNLKAKGAVFVEELDEVPDGVPVIFSAHGVPKAVPAAATARGLEWLDATCPLVSKVHRQAERQIEAGRHILFIGHKGHPEVIGTFGQVAEGEMTLIETIEDVAALNLPEGTPLAYLSQTTLERQHIAAAFVFELSKVETPAIRSRVVAHLLNVDDRLAMNVAEGLRLDTMPVPATRIVPPRDDLPPSPSLSMLRKPPQTFAGRRLGVLVTDGVDASFLRQLETEFNDVGATIELVAPAVGGVKSEDGSWIEARKALATAPSVLFDAVAIAVAAQASREIAKNPLALAFVADAYAHCKFIAYTGDARPLLERALAGNPLDGGCKQVETGMAASQFAAQCAQLRFWAREPVLGL